MALSKRIEITRTLPAPVEDAYAWLTDYDDRDPERAGALILERPVLERSEDHVLLHSKAGMLGLGIPGRIRVEFPDPPHRWVATYIDGLLEGTVDTYELEPAGEGRSRLHVTYDFQVPTGLNLLAVLSKPVTRWQLERMWAGFEESMREELGEGTVPEVPRDSG